MEGHILLQATGLTREFKGYKAVQDLSLLLKQGEVLGLLDPMELVNQLPCKC